MKNQKNILVIKLGALGDFIQALGAMRAIRAHHPQDKITLLTSAPYELLARESGYFNEILLDSRPRWYQLTGWMNLKRTLNSRNFSRIYDLQNNDRTSFYFRLLRTPKPEWVGVAKGASHRNISPLRTTGHAYDGHVQTLALAGVHNVTLDRLEWMKADLSGFSLPRPYVLFVPGCAPSHPYKRWGAEKYGHLALALAKKGYGAVLIGGAAEREIAAVIRQICPAAVDLTEKTKLFDLPELARGAAAAIGNDTGPMHLIGSTGCRSLVLFSGRSDPVRHAPKGENVRTIQVADLGDLSVEEVLAAAEKLIPGA